MKKEEKSIIKTNGIFYRISRFFKKIFANKNVEKNEEQIDTQLVENLSIKNNIIQPNDEKQKLLNLQQKIRNGKIQADELSDDDIEKLNNLYDEQINKLRENIIQNKMVTEKYKQQIIKMKSSM